MRSSTGSSDSAIAARWSVIILLVFGLAQCVGGCRRIDGRMDTYLTAAHELWNFNGSVLIAWRGHVVLEKGYGLANQAMGIANTPQTKFFIGSITKQFTAAAVMILAQRGRLDIHAPITAYLPEYPADPGDRITVHHLLTHTSGLPEYTDELSIFLRRTSAVDPDELLAAIMAKPLLFEPGTSFAYCNSGYILLGEIIRRVSGQSYEAFLHHEIFNPLEMNNSGYARREAGLPDRADGYTTESGGRLITAPLIHFSVLHSAGALYSTVEDMLLWDRALADNTILTEASLEAMLTPYTPHYGYGWYLDSLYGRSHTFHSGFLDGFYASSDRWPDEGLCIVVFSNEDDAPVSKIARGLAAIAFEEAYDFPIRKTPIDIDLALLADYRGAYEVAPGAYRLVTVYEDKLYTYILGEPRYWLRPQAADTFFFAPDNTAVIVFNRNEAGQVASLSYINERRITVADKLDDAPAAEFLIERHPIALPDSILNRYIGRYAITPLDGIADRGAFLLTIEPATPLTLYAVFKDQKVELIPSSATEFYHRAADFLMRFILDETGRVTGCEITLGRNSVSAKRLP